MLKQKKIPMRMCVGCREMKPKRELVRIVKSPAGEMSVDRVGKAPGRGAYLCPSLQCLRRARKAKALEHALETAVPDEVYRRLEEQMQEGAQ